jgi:betaine reductase
VYAGSKPRREIRRDGPALQQKIASHLRSFAHAVAYPPHQVMIGNLHPDALLTIPRPWHEHPIDNAPATGPAGDILDAASFYSWLAQGDCANIVRFTNPLPPALEASLASNHCMTRIKRLEAEALNANIALGAEPLYLDTNDPIGVILPDHEDDESLTAPVLLENASAKVLGALALRRVLGDSVDLAVDHLLGCGEEAVGDRYQRGGGNLAKAMGELAGLKEAGATDVKSFCAGPVHAMILGASLIAGGLHRRVVVVGGGSVPKLGMKFQGHLQAGYPVLEDVLVGVAIDMTVDDGTSPWLRLDCAAFHGLGRGSAAHQMTEALSLEPLTAAGLRLQDVDRYAVELHNPDITEPAGSGNVPLTNYKILAAVAAMRKEISRDDMEAFIAAHGLPGFSPTQGHIASAIPYLPHAVHGLSKGNLQRVHLAAKASLFLGRMTGISDGASLLLERNPNLSL